MKISLEIVPQVQDLATYKCRSVNAGQECKLDPSSVQSPSWAQSDWGPPMCEFNDARQCLRNPHWKTRGTSAAEKKVGTYVSYAIAF